MRLGGCRETLNASAIHSGNLAILFTLTSTVHRMKTPKRIRARFVGKSYVPQFLIYLRFRKSQLRQRSLGMTALALSERKAQNGKVRCLCLCMCFSTDDQQTSHRTRLLFTGLGERFFGTRRRRGRQSVKRRTVREGGPVVKGRMQTLQRSVPPDSIAAKPPLTATTRGSTNSKVVLDRASLTVGRGAHGSSTRITARDVML